MDEQKTTLNALMKFNFKNILEIPILKQNGEKTVLLEKQWVEKMIYGAWLLNNFWHIGDVGKFEKTAKED